jgi:hypothetical protein
MKRYTLSAGLFAAALALVGSANAAQVNFQGEFIITAKSATGCPSDPVGEHFVARFRPQIAGNPDNQGTNLTIFGQRYAQGYRVNTGGFPVGGTAAFRAVDQSMSLGGGFGPFQPTPAIRFLSQAATPAGAVTANTQFINIVGQLRNYDGMAGCTITFRMPLTLRPN